MYYDSNKSIHCFLKKEEVEDLWVHQRLSNQVIQRVLHKKKIQCQIQPSKSRANSAVVKFQDQVG